MSDVNEMVVLNDRLREIKELYKLRHSDISYITGYAANTVKKWFTDSDSKYFQPAPIQAIKLLENWIKDGATLSSEPARTIAKKAEVWSFLNFKGGVGKTTLAFNMALMLAKEKKVLVIDCDPQGHLSSSLIALTSNLKYTTSDLLLNKKGKPYVYNDNLHVIGTDSKLANTQELISASDLLFLLKENVEPYMESYDYVVIDSLPSKGPLYDAVLAASNKVIVPFTADLYDSWGIQDVFQQVKKLKLRKINTNIKVAALVPNKVERPLRNFDQAVIDNVSKAFPNEMCPCYISNSVRVKESKSPAISKPVIDYAPNDRVSEEYKLVLKFIINT